MGLVDRNIAGSPIYFTSRGMNNTLDPEMTSRLQDIQRSFDVGPHIGQRRMVGVRNSNKGRQMKNHIHSPDRLAQTFSIPYVTQDNLHLSLEAGGLQKSPRIVRTVMHQGARLCA